MIHRKEMISSLVSSSGVPRYENAKFVFLGFSISQSIVPQSPLVSPTKSAKGAHQRSVSHKHHSSLPACLCSASASPPGFNPHATSKITDATNQFYSLPKRDRLVLREMLEHDVSNDFIEEPPANLYKQLRRKLDWWADPVIHR